MMRCFSHADLSQWGLMRMRGIYELTNSRLSLYWHLESCLNTQEYITYATQHQPSYGPLGESGSPVFIMGCATTDARNTQTWPSNHCYNTMQEHLEVESLDLCTGNNQSRVQSYNYKLTWLTTMTISLQLFPHSNLDIYFVAAATKYNVRKEQQCVLQGN